jgi:hypothetical protein
MNNIHINGVNPYMESNGMYTTISISMREPSRAKWTYTDWDIFLAAAADWEHFHNL